MSYWWVRTPIVGSPSPGVVAEGLCEQGHWFVIESQTFSAKELRDRLDLGTEAEVRQIRHPDEGRALAKQLDLF